MHVIFSRELERSIVLSKRQMVQSGELIEVTRLSILGGESVESLRKNMLCGRIASMTAENHEYCPRSTLTGPLLSTLVR